MSTLLVLPKLQVQKANAFSSAYSIGFPAMTAWHGFVHALERLLNQSGFDIQLPKMGVVSYGVDVHRHKDRGDRVYSLKDQGKPLKSDASRPSSVESATCDLTVTVIAEIQGEYDEEHLTQTVQRLLRTKLRCCSGVIVNHHKPWLKEIASDSDWFWLRRILMPGQAIISRQDLLHTSMEQTNDAIESMIQCLGVHHKCSVDEESNEVQWTQTRSQNGWIIPMGVGFYGISDLKDPTQILHSRDRKTPHRFVEGVATLCEFVLSYRLEAYEDLLWSASYDSDQQLYLIHQI